MLVALNEEKERVLATTALRKDTIFLSGVWQASYFKAWAQSN